MMSFYKVRYAVMAALCSCAMAVTGSCSGDDDSPVNEDAFAAYNFTLDITAEGRDQADLVNTTVQYKDYLGNPVTAYFSSADGKSISITSHDFSSIPASGTVTVTENIRSGVSYDKETYDLGLTMTLTVTAYSRSGKVISSLNQTATDCASVRPANLSRRYPNVNTFTYSLDRNARVSISHK